MSSKACARLLIVETIIAPFNIVLDIIQLYVNRKERLDLPIKTLFKSAHTILVSHAFNNDNCNMSNLNDV